MLIKKRALWSMSNTLWDAGHSTTDRKTLGAGKMNTPACLVWLHIEAKDYLPSALRPVCTLQHLHILYRLTSCANQQGSQLHILADPPWSYCFDNLLMVSAQLFLLHSHGKRHPHFVMTANITAYSACALICTLQEPWQRRSKNEAATTEETEQTLMECLLSVIWYLFHKDI